MYSKFLLGLTSFAVAAGILGISLFKTASVRYAFESPSPTPTISANEVAPEIGYYLPYPGRVLPDSPIWPAKAFRDWLWYRVTTNSMKRAEIALLFSDKRLAASKILFEKGKPDLALSTLTKSEKYLESAFNNQEKSRADGVDSASFLIKLASASLRHRQTIDEILLLAPEDAKPEIIKSQDYSKNIYKFSRDVLNSKGVAVPKSPFLGD